MAKLRSREADDHPIFSNIKQTQSRSIEAIADRRVQAGREQGLFDNLPLHGKPLPDIDRQRKPGWWAKDFVMRERHTARAMQIEQEIRAAKPAMWRLADRDQVANEVKRLNEIIAEYNRKTTLTKMEPLVVQDVLATWKHLQDKA